MAFKIPEEDCVKMIGKDGGIAEGDAHLTNYRENAKFFLDPFNPSNFEVVWNSASTIYKSLGTINTTVPAGQGEGRQRPGRAWPRNTRTCATFRSRPSSPDALFKMSAEAGAGQVLTKAVMISFEPNKTVLNPEYDTTIPGTLEEIGKLAGTFGNAYIVIEGNTDASRKGIVPADLVRQLSYDRADCRAQGDHGEIQVRPEQVQGGRQRLGQSAARLHRPQQCGAQQEEPPRRGEGLPAGSRILNPQQLVRRGLQS